MGNVGSDLTNSVDSVAKFPTLMYDLVLYGGIAFIFVGVFAGVAMGIGQIRSPAQISLNASVPPFPT